MASLGLIANYGSDEEDSSYTDSDDNASNSVTLVKLKWNIFHVDKCKIIIEIEKTSVCMLSGPVKHQSWLSSILGSFEKLCCLIKLDTDFSFQIGKGRNHLSDNRLPQCSIKL